MALQASRHRHAKEDALDAREFQFLLEGARELPSQQAQEARFVVLVAGRLGLRAGEIAHMRESWIDFRREMIEIPTHQACRKGDGSGVCGYCRAQARQMAETDPDLSLEEATARMWSPKTAAAAREVPFGHDARTAIALERFFDERGEWPYSRAVVNRRVTAAAERAQGIDSNNCYPHALRATCATRLAGRGLELIALKAMMGWSKLSTAKAYLADSGENTARALYMVHSR